MGLNSYSAYVYVDANYVRSRLREAGFDDEFNPSSLWQMVGAQSTDGQPIRPVRMFFYDAIDEKADQAERDKLQRYLEQVEQVPYVTVVTGFIRPGKRKRREQKGVDVQIAVDVLEAAWSKRADAICLIAGDADFCPLCEAVRRAGPFMLVFGYEKSISKELLHAADVFALFPPLSATSLKPISP